MAEILFLGAFRELKAAEKDQEFTPLARMARVEQLWSMAVDSIFWEFGVDGLVERLRTELRRVEKDVKHGADE
jgi:hypothetical protein